MRRLTIHRPKAKIRGKKRRLKALDRWADSFAGYFPEECAANFDYINWRLPVVDRLVDPPTTNHKIQRQAISALMRVGCHLLSARPRDSQFAAIQILIVYPQMFGSEVCIFFDRNYYDSFCDRDSEWSKLRPKAKPESLLKKLSCPSSDEFVEAGYDFWLRDEEELLRQEWWVLREKLV